MLVTELEEQRMNILLHLGTGEVFTTAREVGEWLNVTSQKASAILRKLESDGLLFSKKIKAGRGEVKVYAIPFNAN